MSEAIIVALITGLLSLAGVIITSVISNQKIQAEIKAEIKTAIAVQDTKIDELTREVRRHNNFAERMPVVENEIKHIKDDIHKYHD